MNEIDVWNIGEMKDKKEGLIHSRKFCQGVDLSTTNPAWNCLVVNLDPIHESQATNTTELLNYLHLN
jgi:hypothetical protein